MHLISRDMIIYSPLAPLKHALPGFICIVFIIGAWFIPSEALCLDLLDLEPGMTRSEVERMLWWKSLRARDVREDSIILSLQLIPVIPEQQRTILKFDNERRLFSVNLQIFPAHNSSGEDIISLFQNAREWLIGRLGPPEWERREGSAPPDEILDALKSGAMVRVLQWENSFIIRFGIPQRVSGKILVEVLVAPLMFPKGSKFWGGRLY
jgi:hypothetical protein